MGFFDGFVDGIGKIIKTCREEYNNISAKVGSNKTYITNACPLAGCIWLHFRYKQPGTDQINEEINESAPVAYGGDYIKLRDTYYEFLTVDFKNLDGTSTTICENYKIFRNRSFIVTDIVEGKHTGICTITPSGYGKNIWEDEKGYNHKP
jgi:hypothetical protein